MQIYAAKGPEGPEAVKSGGGRAERAECLVALSSSVKYSTLPNPLGGEHNSTHSLGLVVAVGSGSVTIGCSIKMRKLPH